LIAMVVVSILGAAMTRTMVQSNRFIEKMEYGREARGTGRIAANLASTELRMVSAGTGVESADDSSVTLRVPFRMGLVCQSTVGAPGAVVAMFQPSDTSIASLNLGYNGFAWLTSAGEYAYVDAVSAPVSGSTGSCTGAPASLTLVTGASVRTLFGANIVAPVPIASPIVLWRRVRYVFAPSAVMPGRGAFWRRTLDNDWNVIQSDELAAPLDPVSRFAFYINNNRTASDTVPTALGDLRGLELRVLGESARMTRGDVRTEQSRVTTSIFFLNRPD
jgi:hypothetical protein